MQNRPIVWWPNSLPHGHTYLLALWHLEGMTIEPSIWATTGCYAFQALRNMLHKSIKNNSGCRNCGPYSRCRSLSRSALGNPRKNIPGNGRFTAIWKEKLQRLLRCTTVKKSPQRSEAFKALYKTLIRRAALRQASIIFTVVGFYRPMMPKHAKP